jgi:hypothetical protein
MEALRDSERDKQQALHSELRLLQDELSSQEDLLLTHRLAHQRIGDTYRHSIIFTLFSFPPIIFHYFIFPFPRYFPFPINFPFPLYFPTISLFSHFPPLFPL